MGPLLINQSLKRKSKSGKRKSANYAKLGGLIDNGLASEAQSRGDKLKFEQSLSGDKKYEEMNRILNDKLNKRSLNDVE